LMDSEIIFKHFDLPFLNIWYFLSKNNIIFYFSQMYDDNKRSNFYRIQREVKFSAKYSFTMLKQLKLTKIDNSLAPISKASQ